jgi:predicted enzyme related to lactoylglutathione lyase
MKIDKFTIAVTHMEKMVKFYNTVLDTQLKAIEGSPFYAGQLADTELLFCPNFITEIKADKNRIQFRLIVDDLEEIVNKARTSGGSEYGDCVKTEQVINWAISDPDGNSIEIIQYL